MSLSGSLGARVRALSADRVDGWLAVALCAVGLLEVALAVGSPSAVELLLLAVLTLPLAWRRRRPPGAALLITAAIAAQAVVLAEPLFTRTFTGFVCLLVAAYSLGRYARSETFLRAIAGCGLAVGLALGFHDSSVVSGIFGAAIVLGCGAAGRAVRRRAGVREILEVQARELEASGDAAAKAAAIDERLQIAGDLEDVVSHRVCEMVVQAQAARRLARTDLARAGDALALVEEQGRVALGEMRRLLGVLRGAGDEGALKPFPSLLHVSSLVETMRLGGLQTALVVEGGREALPVEVDVAAYRVIEATLGQAAQRPDHGAASVVVRHLRDALEVELVLEGGGLPPAAGAARPTIGIDERVAAFGGELHTQRRRDGAYALHARLPLEAPARTPRPSPHTADCLAAAPTATRQPRRRRSRLAERLRDADVLLVIALTGTMAAEAAIVPAREGPAIANALAGLLVGASLLVRRRFPLEAAVAGWTAVLLMAVFLTPATELAAVLASVLLLAYAAGAHEPRSRAWAGLAVSLVGLIALNLTAPDARSDDVVFPAVLLGLAWLAGRLVRAEGAMAAEVARRAQRIELARENQAAVAAAEERQRMARELHDVVAHAITIMVVQAAGARRNLQRAPGPAGQAITAAEQAGREALNELRRLLTLVHPTANAPLAPQPGLAQLEGLVERTRAGGLSVELRIEGEPVSLPGGLDLAAYRVVQEALTNALRHAGPARACVTVRYGTRRLLLKIHDDGCGPTATHAAGQGHGIAGMRERVRLYGGELVAGPRRGGGFEVTATLPLACESQVRELHHADDEESRLAAATREMP